jgi:hypothetical protein
MSCDQRHPGWNVIRAAVWLPRRTTSILVAHERVVHADVVEAVVQPSQDAARCAADHRSRGPQEDGAHDDADRAAADPTLHRSAILGLVDLDPTELGPVRDRSIDDADVVVQFVDLLDGLEEPPGGLPGLEHERRQGLFCLFCLLGHRITPRPKGSGFAREGHGPIA